MGYPGRKKRLKSFQNRASAFLIDTKRLKRVKTVIRDRREIVVGEKQNKRLILKRSPEHLRIVRFLENKLLTHLSKGNIKPKKYKLVQLFATQDGVQEYYKRPTVMNLVNFFSGQLKKSASTKEDYEIVKRFINQPQNKGITIENIIDTLTEFREHLRESVNNKKAADINDSNILVLGKTKEGQLRIAIIDI